MLNLSLDLPGLDPAVSSQDFSQVIMVAVSVRDALFSNLPNAPDRIIGALLSE